MFEINVKQFLDSLPKMGLGMLGIFIVTGLIILTIVALNFFTKPKYEASKPDSASDPGATKKVGSALLAVLLLIVIVVGVALIYLAVK